MLCIVSEILSVCVDAEDISGGKLLETKYKAYVEEQQQIKQYLTIGAIAWENNIEVTEEDIQQYCIDNEIVLEHLESQQKNQIECEILTSKVFRFLRESFGKE